MSTIPASTIVNVIPSVIGAGGTGLNGLGLILSHNTRLPVGSVQSFADAQSVSDFFGATDSLAAEASVYFGGFIGDTIQPTSLLMAQYNQAPVAGYLRGGDVSDLTLAELQAVTGPLTVVVDGVSRTYSSVNLTSATSFSNAAALIEAGLNGSPATVASASGSVAAESASFTGSIAGNILTVTAVASGTLVYGSALSGSGVTAGTTLGNQLSGTTGGIGTYAVSASQVVASEAMTAAYGQLTITGAVTGAFGLGLTLSGTGVAANTIVVALGTGTGGDGTYFVNNDAVVSSTTISAEGTSVAVTYDSVSGAFVVASGITGAASTVAFATGSAAAPLGLTSATGATLSQGADVSTPAAFMNALVVANSTWVNFMTEFDPDGGGGNAVKQQFAAWKNTAGNGGAGNRYGYFCWDPDATPSTSNDAASSLGRLLEAANDSGTLLVWEGGETEDSGLCAFALGWAAAINYGQTNGRADLAFRRQAGLTANVTDPTTAANLLANGYNFYGAYGSAAESFVWFQNGQITGDFAWADSWQTQAWLNSSFQQEYLSLFENSLSVPFTQGGRALIQQAGQTVIQQGLDFGAFAPNTLTPSQIAQVNARAGQNIAAALQGAGYYLQVNIPAQTVQADRGPWPILFFYIDRNSVHTLDLSSVMVQ